MNQSIPSTEHEYMTAAQRIEAKGMAKGMANCARVLELHTQTW